MGKINSRAKGAAGEREFANYLKKRGYDARRGQQFKGTSDSPDVECPSLPFHWECKRVQNFRLYSAVKQAAEECGPNQIPVVAHRKNGEEWVAVLRMDDFMDLVEGKRNV